MTARPLDVGQQRFEQSQVAKIDCYFCRQRLALGFQRERARPRKVQLREQAVLADDDFAMSVNAAVVERQCEAGVVKRPAPGFAVG